MTWDEMIEDLDKVLEQAEEVDFFEDLTDEEKTDADAEAFEIIAAHRSIIPRY